MITFKTVQNLKYTFHSNIIFFVIDPSSSEMTRLGNNVPTANPRLRL
jgi:hypothetical protein